MARFRLPKRPPPSPATVALIAEAATAGRQAFEAGMTRVPAHDPAVIVILRKNTEGMSAAPDILAGWLSAWDKANLAAPVEGF